MAGAAGNDVFTGGRDAQFFEGRGGNDTFNLGQGGHDTLLYRVLQLADNTGGNGSDSVNGFTMGIWEGTTDAGRLDVHALLTGYAGDGSASYINGVATISSTAGNISDFLRVDNLGGNATISIDRDGTGSTYQSTAIAILNGVTTDLATLLANHQLTVV